MPAAGLTFAVAGCPVQEHADPPHLFGLRAGVDQQINSRRLTGRRFSQTRLSYHTADERTALSGTLPLDVCFGSHSEEYNRVDWRSTLQWAATAERWQEREIVRRPALRKRVGTAFSTARLVEFALSAEDTLLFRFVGPFHHGGDAKPICFVFQLVAPVFSQLVDANVCT
jgi:hypothetical protein